MVRRKENVRNWKRWQKEKKKKGWKTSEAELREITKILNIRLIHDAKQSYGLLQASSFKPQAILGPILRNKCYPRFNHIARNTVSSTASIKASIHGPGKSCFTVAAPIAICYVRSERRCGKRCGVVACHIRVNTSSMSAMSHEGGPARGCICSPVMARGSAPTAHRHHWTTNSSANCKSIGAYYIFGTMFHLFRVSRRFCPHPL